jgi:hypothetical protein
MVRNGAAATNKTFLDLELPRPGIEECPESGAVADALDSVFCTTSKDNALRAAATPSTWVNG